MKMIHFARFVYEYIMSIAGRCNYCSERSYLLMRRLYRVSSGASARALAWPLEVCYGRRRRGEKGPDQGRKGILASLKEEGFVKVKASSITTFLCSRIHDGLLNKPVSEMVPPGMQGMKWASAGAAMAKSSSSPRLNHQRCDVMAEPRVWSLMKELSLVEIASMYLGCRPVLTSIESWHVVPINNTANRERFYSTSAQTFHYDLDWIRFVKVFVNLGPSDDENGAFEFVLRSHKKRSKSMYKDRRIIKLDSDNGKVVCAYGEAGDAFFVDTSGIHRDGRATKKSRHVLQYEFAVSSFGAAYLYQDDIKKASAKMPWKHIESLYPDDSRLLCMYKNEKDA